MPDRLSLFHVGLILFGVLHYCCGNCVWYGQCGHQPDSPEKTLNCPYSGPPKRFNTDKARALFAELCPDLYTGPNVETCCDDSQLEKLADQVDVPREALRRCPSCYHNFMNIWCYLSCAPNQNQFLTINQTGQFTYPNSSTATAVKSLNYYISESSANALFNSCQNVQFPSTNTPVLSILCGTTVDRCTVKTWLDFMGTTSNGQTPFDIWFHINDTSTPVGGQMIRPLEFKSYRCDEAPSNFLEPCSCQDCLATCARVQPSVPQAARCRIADVDCYDFAFAIVYAFFVLFFCTCQVFLFARRRRRKSEEKESSRCCGRKKALSVMEPAQKTQDLDGVAKQQLGRCESTGVKMEVFLQRKFFQWGHLCARHPFIIITIVLIISGALCAGIALFSVIIDPVKLWSAPNSRARTEKDYFDSHFVPFYRTEQLIISRPGNETYTEYKKLNYTNLFDKDFLHQLLDLQDAIAQISILHNNRNITLQDICFAPLHPDNNNCTIQSVLNYYQNSHEMIDKLGMDKFGWFVMADYRDHFESCVLSPYAVNDTTELHTPCMGTFGGPVLPWVALGGYSGKEYRTAKAFVITILVNNYLDPDLNEPAEVWESKFIEFMKNYTEEHPDIHIAFSAERSIEDEIDRESKSDVITILVSYLIMFAYVTVCLGQYTNLSRILVDAKISLGLSGVIIVLLSVGSSLGFYSYLSIPSTLIIIEVIPFLVLAVGVDNIFILVQKYQRTVCGDDEAVEHMIGRVMAKAGPTMLLTSLSESLAFFLGALTEMPAVKVFSLYAGMAVLINFLLQISIFVSLLSLDAKRQEANRIDVLCCTKLQLKKRQPENGILYSLVSDYYSHFLLNDWVRPLVMLVFVAWLCVCGALTSRMNVGLDQSLAMPKDSYVLDYFRNLSEYLNVGAPVYFVVEEGQDYSTYGGQNDICGISGCPEDSLVQQINTAAHSSSRTYIAEPVSSWLDDYFSWVFSSSCCRYDTVTGKFCSSAETSPTCAACPLDQVDRGRPVEHTFNKYLPWFLGDNPGIRCAKGGHAAYGPGVELYRDAHNETRVGASYFMTYHTVLKTSTDYIEALRMAREISDNITQSLNHTGQKHKVFPYSKFYVFYEQYLNIVTTAVLNIAYCLTAILVITFLLLGFDLHSAVIVVVTISMILVNIMGLMYLWDVELNALSLVNLIMSIGISVEFCSHIVRSFAVSISPTRTERAQEALSDIGSSVLSGITLTKIAGIIMLAFSKSQLFQVFYFRMYLAMVVFGAAHGLIFLPVFLSYIGPPVNKARVYKSQIVHETDEPPADQRQTIDMNTRVHRTPSYNSFNTNMD